MNVQEYCSHAQSELSGWRAKILKAAAGFDEAPCGDKDKFLSSINDLHIIIEEMNDRIEELRNECSTTWWSEEEKTTPGFEQLDNRWEEFWKSITPAEGPMVIPY